ncbi:mechanosensitive ion channel [Campylobacter sp. RM12327]|uniref:mechanosensitive ion channel domain-containing protein n=1 Tax=Campylobacter sputorum TaxID=206 RepID=UPI000B77AFBC|nr:MULTISPECIES: mechanosensitive ion channel domain-containing protein [Campylobacter]ASM40423.1 small conductance mechanosensitive channel protein [Campylobacter sputorum]MBE7357301.1 mechanosensitive ion channel [Campylobacter sp. RM11302]MBF6668611.1 mechanosensitive ion channel [Campylobacter sp. RM12327]MBF6674133.1 mechanosensitive ion channel [Campylobacter sp. RM13538]MBF6675602.1 mechanosensitive ion channel [Campylobacter sp. RM12321]
MNNKFISIFILISFCLNFLYATDNNSSNVLSSQNQELAENISKMVDANLTQDNQNQELVNIIAQKIVDDNTTEKTEDTLKNTLFEFVDELIGINKQIDILKWQNDQNSTEDEVQKLTNTKTDLLNKIPSAITNQKFPLSFIEKYIEEKKKLTRDYKKYKNNTKSEQFIKTAIKLYTTELSEIFYSTLIKIEKMFIEGTNQSELKDIIEKSLLNIKTNNFTKIKILENDIDNSAQELYKEDFYIYELHKKTYEEIFEFLLSNTNLLASNMFFTSLNLKGFIKFINQRSPFDVETINSGKVVLISVIMLFFFSLRKSFANIIYFIFTIFSKNKDHKDNVKKEVVDIIKKPMGFLLLAYGVDISMSIFFYPSPVPIKFASGLNIVYILLYAWLVTSVMDGYGVMIIGHLAKKGGKKEILNLFIKVIYIIVIIIAILLILSSLGFNVSAFVASLGIGGLAIALATKDIIANFFASIMLILDNTFSQGDWIVCGNVEGTVVETGLRKTTIRTFDNALVFVPNSKIMDNSVKNWNRRKVGRQIKMYLSIDYSTTPNQIKACIADIKDMLTNHPGIAVPVETTSSKEIFKYGRSMVSVDDLAGYKNNLFVVLDEFSESSINIMIYCFSKSVVWAEFLSVKEDVMLRIMDILEKHHVKFAFPTRSIYLENAKDLRD